MHREDPPPPRDRRAQLNADVWARGEFVEDYTGTELKPVEGLILDRYGELLSGSVLEIGCGGGRFTGHLLALAEHVTAVDIAPAMIEHCRRAYPDASYAVVDLRDLSSFATASFGAVFAMQNVLDSLGHEQRQAVLAEIARLLTPAGAFVFSTHNLAFAPSIPPPTSLHAGEHLRARAPMALVQEIVAVPRRLRNHRRLAPLQSRATDHAVLIDEAHDYSLLHYYVDRDAQQRALAAVGFELLECLDLGGRTVAAGETAPASSELHYVARCVRADHGSSSRESASSASA
jgi:SAM-dependent methyltransferase